MREVRVGWRGRGKELRNEHSRFVLVACGR